ncbi:hypothetical protein FO519_005339 [Halicephalobus sp. NKZ332]|nr:hypothetical protein FO519_005339 [Halicephalobus sp. NKZ332]
MLTAWDAKLHKAAASGDLYALQQLLDSGKTDVDCMDQNGYTALMRAAGNGYCDACILLIDEGANVNATKPDGATALMYASENGHVDVVEVLLKEGARADSRTKEGGTALLNAAQSGQTSVCRLLLASGGSSVHECLADGANGAFLCAQNGHLDTLALLAEEGCKLDLPRSGDGATPLYIASQLGHYGIVNFLLKRGVRDTESVERATALFKGAQKGFDRIVRLLLDYETNLGLLKNGESALHAAALFGHPIVVKQLLDAGSDPKLQNRHGETPLDLALQMNYDEVVDLLRKRI